MADITYTDKVAGGTFSHEDANEVKSAVNSKVDKETGKVLSDNNYTDDEQTKLSGIETGAQVNATNTVIDASYVHTDNNFDNTDVANLTAVTPPAVGTLATGSNAINLTNIAGQEYHPYNMSSGNLTITVGVNPVAGASAHFIKIGDGSHTFTSSAFTTLSGEDDNTLNVVTHVFISYKLNSSDTLAGFIQFVQQP